MVIVLDAFSENDPALQLNMFRQELVFADLEIVTNRIGRLEEQTEEENRPAKEKEVQQAELDLLRRIHAQFEAEKPLAELQIKQDEEKLIRSFQMLTLKPEVVPRQLRRGRLEEAAAGGAASPGPDSAEGQPETGVGVGGAGRRGTGQLFMADMGLERFVRGRGRCWASIRCWGCRCSSRWARTNAGPGRSPREPTQ